MEEAQKQMLAWLVADRRRFVRITPEIWSTSYPLPDDILTLTSNGNGPRWGVTVGLEIDDDATYETTVWAFTIPEAWEAALKMLRAGVT